MNARTLATLLCPILLGLGACATHTAMPVPGATAPQAETAPGYGMSLVSITPRAGTPLAPGRTAIFSVTVRYHLDVAEGGVIVLVPQDGSGASLVGERPQASIPVRRGAGQVTISDTLTIPRGIAEVRLFVVLAPDGYTTTSGEIVERFPVRGE